MEGLGRSREIPRKMLIELDDAEYRVLESNDNDAATQAELRACTLGSIVLGQDGQLSVDQIRADERWGSAKPTKPHLLAGLQELVGRGLFARGGKGVKGDPHTFGPSKVALEMAEIIVTWLAMHSADGVMHTARAIAGARVHDPGDVDVVAAGLVARGRVRKGVRNGRWGYAIVAAHDDNVGGGGDQPVALVPRLERDVRDALGDDPGEVAA
jgi:hypothetical protein